MESCQPWETILSCREPIELVSSSLELGVTYSKHPSSHFLQPLGATFDPSLRPEDVTVFAKDSYVSVEDPGIHADSCSRWDELPMKDHSAFWYVTLEHETCAGVDPKRLYDHGIAARRG